MCPALTLVSLIRLKSLEMQVKKHYQEDGEESSFYQYTNRNFRFKMCGISDTWYIPFEILVNIRVFPTLNWYNYINLRKKHCVDQWSKITKAIGCFRWIHFSFQLY